MKLIEDWIAEKLAHDWLSVSREVAVSHEWRRNLGARMMRAGLTVSLSPAAQFEMNDDGSCASERYLLAARNGVVSVLMSACYAPILKVKVELKGFAVSDAHSSYAAFFSAAQEATKKALQLAESPPG